MACRRRGERRAREIRILGQEGKEVWEYLPAETLFSFRQHLKEPTCITSSKRKEGEESYISDEVGLTVGGGQLL